MRMPDGLSVRLAFQSGTVVVTPASRSCAGARSRPSRPARGPTARSSALPGHRLAIGSTSGRRVPTRPRAGAGAASPSRRTGAWMRSCRSAADVHQAEMADAQRLGQLLELLAHRRRRAGDDVALVDELLPASCSRPCSGWCCRPAPRRRRASRPRSCSPAPGRARIEVQALVEEVVDVRPPLALARGVGVADADLLEEGAAVRVLLGAALARARSQ